MDKSLHPYQIIVRPLITEKATNLTGENKYVFEVHTRANKPQIRAAVETAFDVRVVKVNTLNVRGKTRRVGQRQTHARSWKKAIITLVEGDTIQLFEGV